MTLFEGKKKTGTHLVLTNKSVFLLMTVKELFSVLFTRAAVINPNHSYSLVRYREEMYISSSHSVNTHPFFKNKKIHRVRKFMGSSLAGISISNPLDDSINCPVFTEQIPVQPDSTGINAVCPLAYQDDMNMIESVPVDRREVFDQYGRASLDLYGQADSTGIDFFCALTNFFNSNSIHL